MTENAEKVLIVDESDESREALRLIRYHFPSLPIEAASPEDIAENYRFPKLITSEGSLIGLAHVKVFCASHLNSLITATSLIQITPNQLLTIISEPGAFQWGHFRLPAGHTDVQIEPMEIGCSPFHTTTIGNELAAPFTNDGIDRVLCAVNDWNMHLGERVSRVLGKNLSFAATGAYDCPVALRNGFEIFRGERVLIVHDVAERDTDIGNLCAITNQSHAQVAGIAVFASRSLRDTQSLSSLAPKMHVLLQLDLPYYVSNMIPAESLAASEKSCPMCQEGIPLIEA